MQINRTNRLFQLGALINKIRVVQGWNLLGPEETKPIAAIWDKELERYEIPVAVYDKLIELAIDHRLRFLQRGEQAPAFSIELILAMFQQHREDTRRGLEGLDTRIEIDERQLKRLLEVQDTKDIQQIGHELESAAHYGHDFRTISDLIDNVRKHLEASIEKRRKLETESYLFD